MERIAPFAERIHIDLADGVFTDNPLIDISHIWWPVGVTTDIHIMYEAVRPFTEALIAHKPHMVIMHAEAVGNYYTISKPFKQAGIKVGVALLQRTPVSQIKHALPDIDHVLIFSGHLGHFGGNADLELLSKVRELRKHRKDLEIGWDGGITKDNIGSLAEAGVNVFNIGGAIQRAPNPHKAYDTLKALAKRGKQS